MKLTGHTVLITGGASGIGLALAKAFIQNENHVIIVGQKELKLNQVKAQFPNITTYRCNIGNEEELDILIKTINDKHPELNILINNAGIQHNYFFTEELDPSDQVVKEIQVNLTSPILLISKLLPLLTRQSQAAIVNVSSGLGLVPKKSAAVYCGTKAGLHIFTKALRYQLEDTPVKVFEIIPPVVDTDMTKGRGRNKISPEKLAEEFMSYFHKNREEVPIGQIKLLKVINRWFPHIAERILKNS